MVWYQYRFLIALFILIYPYLSLFILIYSYLSLFILTYPYLFLFIFILIYPYSSLFILISYNEHFGLSPNFWQRKTDCPIVHGSCLLARCPFAPMNSLTLKLAEEEQSPCSFERGYPPVSSNVAIEKLFLVECFCYVCFLNGIDGTITRITYIPIIKYAKVDGGFDRKTIPIHQKYCINQQFLVVLPCLNQRVAIDLDPVRSARWESCYQAEFQRCSCWYGCTKGWLKNLYMSYSRFMIFMLFFMLLCAILLGYKKWWLEKYQATDQQGVQTDQLVSESSLLGRKRSKFQSQDPKSEMKKKLHNDACLLISIRYVFFIPVNLWWLGTQLIARFDPWDDHNQILPSKTMATCWNKKSPSKSPTGWWFGTWFLFVHILGIIIPTD